MHRRPLGKTGVELIRLDPLWKTQGLRFCERLLKRSDDELRAGGLSRMEIVQAIDELRDHKLEE